MNNPQTLSEQLAWNIARTFDESIQKSIYQRCIKEIQYIDLDKVTRKNYNAVDEYQKRIRKRYEKQAESIIELWPNGCFTKDKDGGFVGIDITLKWAIREMLELERLKKRWWEFWKPGKTEKGKYTESEMRDVARKMFYSFGSMGQAGDISEKAFNKVLDGYIKRRGLPVYKDSPPTPGIDTTKLDHAMQRVENELKEFDIAMKDLETSMINLRNRL